MESDRKHTNSATSDISVHPLLFNAREAVATLNIDDIMRYLAKCDDNGAFGDLVNVKKNVALLAEDLNC